MKVLWTISYFTPYISGMTLYADRITKLLNDVQSTVLCNRHETGLKAEERIDGLVVVRAEPLAQISKGFISIDWYLKLVKLLRKNDVVGIHLPQAEAGLSAIVAKIMGKKIICIYHCEIDYPNKFVQKILEYSNSVALRLADKIVVYTFDYAKSTRLLKASIGRVDEIYPPIPELPDNVSEREIIQSKLKHADIVLGIAARLAEEKGIEYALDALKSVNKKLNKKVILAIAGPMSPVGEEKYQQKILKLVEAQKDKIVFLGTIRPEDMGAFYREIDVLLLPSINSTEAFGMVQVEGMKLGVPVVATDLPGVRVPIKVTGMGELVPPKDSAALAEAIVEVIKNKLALGKRQSVAKKEFDIQNTAEKYKIILAKIM